MPSRRLAPGPWLTGGTLLLLALLCTEARAQPGKHTQDTIVFARGDALWSIGPTGENTERLLDLPYPAEEVESLRVSGDGSALLLSGKGLVAWTALGDRDSRKLRILPCSGPSNISAHGHQVVCGTKDAQRIAIYTLRPQLGVAVIDRKAGGPLFFAENQGEIVSYGDKGDLVALSKDGARVLSAHRPEGSLTITPNGKRAVGGYSEDAIEIVYAFRLDGKATKRTLVHAAKAVHTSGDSRWVAVQQEVDACAVRIQGGQYMCWREYKSLAISSQGQSLLLSRGKKGKRDLYLGAVNGTSSKKPLPLIEGVAGAATFWKRALPEAAPPLPAAKPKK
jgi:hypothetical protein